MVVEGQFGRSLNGQTVGLRVFTNAGCPFGCLTVEEDRPALLEECEERLPVRNKSLKRPVVEDVALAQKLDEPPVEVSWDSLAAVVTAQQHPQEI